MLLAPSKTVFMSFALFQTLTFHHISVKRCVSERGSTILVVNVAKLRTPQWLHTSIKHKTIKSLDYNKPQHLSDIYPNVITTVYHLQYHILCGQWQDAVVNEWAYKLHTRTHTNTDKPLEGAVLIVDRRSSLGQSL